MKYKSLFSFHLKPRHRNILRLIRERRVQLYLAMFCMMIMSATTAASAFLLKNVIDDIFIRRDAFMLKLLPVAVIIIFLLRGLSMFGQEYLMSYVGQSIILRLRNILYAAIQDLPISFFQAEKTGVLMSRITNDVNIVKNMVSTAVTSALRDFFTIFFLTLVIFYRDWKLALLAMFIMPAAWYPVVAIGRRVRSISTGCQEAMADMNAFLHETFAGNKIVKAFGMETYEKSRFYDKSDELFRLEIKSVVAKALGSPIMEFLAGIGIAGVIWIGGFQVIKGISTPGTFFSFMGAVIMLYDPVKKLSRLHNSVQQGMAAVDRIYDIIERPSEIREPEHPLPLPSGGHEVRFENVSFAYNPEDGPVLQDIDLHARPGEVIALVGMSGGGKTTLVNLIPRFFDVTQGVIRVDDVDIRQIAIAKLRHQIAIVTQEPILFNDTIRSNIAYGNPEADEDAIIAAAKAAFAYDFVMRFPKGFDTTIGELGGRLSGGEKQRVCIARALLKDAPILILDEATSSLDTEAEMLVQKALENLMQGRTTFVIAHRLSTIAHADRILAMAGGRIVEEGRHEELLMRKGAYHKLYDMQFGKKEAFTKKTPLDPGS